MHIAIYTDGSYDEDHAFHEQRAGYGVVILERTVNRATQIYTDKPIMEVASPVHTEATADYYFGADCLSNNTAELSAICDGLRWLLQQAPRHIDAILQYDSTYAAGIAQGIYIPSTNHALSRTARDLATKVARHRRLHFQHVKGHSGDT